MSESHAAHPSLLARAHANYQEMFRALARVSPDGMIEEDPDVLLVQTGPLLPLNNTMIVKTAPADPVALLARGRAFFAASGQLFAVTTAGPVTDAMTAAAGAAGLTADPSPAMLLAPLTGRPDDAPGLTVRVVQDIGSLRVYNDTMTTGFGDEWALRAIVESGVLLDVPDLTHYAGFIDGLPVATAMRFTSHRIAGIFNVSTIPEYRRRGIGAAITWRAALDGLAEGCIASFLQASEMGEPVYKRMGYRAVDTVVVWLPAASDS